MREIFLVSMKATVTAGLMWPPLNEAATKTAMKMAKPKANAMFSKVVEPRKQLPGGAWTVNGTQRSVSGTKALERSR